MTEEQYLTPIELAKLAVRPVIQFGLLFASYYAFIHHNVWIAVGALVLAVAIAVYFNLPGKVQPTKEMSPKLRKWFIPTVLVVFSVAMSVISYVRWGWYGLSIVGVSLGIAAIIGVTMGVILARIDRAG